MRPKAAPPRTAPGSSRMPISLRVFRSSAGRGDCGSVRPHRSLDGGAQHQSTLGRGKIGARMRGTPVVPEQKVADPPDVLVDELALLRMVEDLLEHRRTFRL